MTITPPSQRHVHFPQDKTDEIADLIDKLGKMSINDPNYNVLYFLITEQAQHMCPFLKPLPRVQDGSTPDANPSALTPPPMAHHDPRLPCPLTQARLSVIAVEKQATVQDNAQLLRRWSKLEQSFEMTLAELCGRTEPPSCV